MNDPSDSPTIDLCPTPESPTLTRVVAGVELPPLPAPTNFAPPGFEIIAELGRGGMGVVYRARQRSLQRMVALKVILGAGHANADQLARFKAEATTAAQLQHPNIVQIFEVGEHDGQPFFSLELVEGGSLAALLKGDPQPPREAAELVRILALAIQHAHSKGVVHRDLKPSNVLLSSDATSTVTIGDSAFQPKIVDFGLAKQQESDSGLTASGAIIGTPSYMAPEQAGGHGKVVGPAADIYALGALLYEMLTGRPPFRGATVMDTVFQVLHGEVVPPSRLQPKLPRDLETICLKCLAKKPEQRYASATALAEDLGRFLESKPILARPASPIRKLGKWAVRYPALATIVFILAVPLPAFLGVTIYLWIEAREAKKQVERDKIVVERAREDTERERALAHKILQNALDTMDRILERVGDERISRSPAMQEERDAIMAEATAFYESLLRIDSADPTIRFEAAQAHARVGRLAVLAGHADQSTKAMGDAIALLNQLVAEFPEHSEYRNEMARVYVFKGHSLVLQGQFTDGLGAYEKAAELAEGLARDYPEIAIYRATAGDARRSLGYFYSIQDPTKADEHFRKALEAIRDLPDSAENRTLTADTLGAFGKFQLNRRNFAEAEPALRRGLELVEAKSLKQPRAGAIRRVQVDHAAITLQTSLALLCLQTRREAEGMERIKQAVADHEARGNDAPPTFPYRMQAAGMYDALSRVKARQKEFAAATDASTKTLALYDGLLTDFPVFRDSGQGSWLQVLRSQALVFHVSCLARAGRRPEALEAVRSLESSPPPRAGTAYDVGCVLAVLAGNSMGQVKEDLCRRSLKWLKTAAETGYPSTPQQVEHIREKDEDLAVLRSRPDFQEWAKNLVPKKAE